MYRKLCPTICTLFAACALFFSVGLLGRVNAETKCLNKDYYEDHTDECDKLLNTTSEKLQKAKDQQSTITNQIKDYLSKLSVTDAQLTELKNDIQKVKEQLEDIEENLNDRKGSLEEKTQIRNKLVRAVYQAGRPSVVETLFATLNTGSSVQSFIMRDIFEDRVGTDAAKSIISLNIEITNFENDKQAAGELRADLEAAQKQLLTLKADIDAKKLQAQNQYADLEEKTQDYEETIAKLSALQTQILAEKSGSESGSVGDYESPKAGLPDPKFSPAYVAISYGAYTHYKGMSQYGAKGRAEDGKDYKEILKFYYKTDVEKVSGFPDKINVSGYGKLDFQFYLYGIAEMPTSWPKEALKAQAIAARSYAYRYAKSGQTICTTQSCQVFSKSKADAVKNGNYSSWKKAVDDTKGMVLDGDVVAYYSSTTGGYIENIGWDSKGDWPGGAYEKRAGSPWFYKAWYTKSYNDSSTCGRGDPYLTEKEMADILNAVVVWTKGNSGDRSRVSPETTSCWGGDPYSKDKMKDRASDLGTAYSSVSSVDVEIGNNGKTTKVKFGTDKGTVTIDGEVFKTVFNLRSPGYISIKDRLYEMVKK